MTPPGTRPAWLPGACVFACLALASATAAQTCPGDCTGNRFVSAPEIATAVDIALLQVSLEACEAANPVPDGMVTIDELVLAVLQRLHGCGFVPPTPTAAPNLPDLVPEVVEAIKIGSGCTNEPLRLSVCVRNDGAADSPAFEVLVYDSLRLAFDPLASGAHACGTTEYRGSTVPVRVDPDGLVAEASEQNNEQSYNAPPPTDSVTCVPTAAETRTPLPPGSPSPTPEPTLTPTASRTATCACTFTATQTASPARTATPPPTATPTQTPGLPDLIPARVVLIAPTPEGGCIDDFSEIMLSLEVCVLNDSNSPAGPFEASLTVAATLPVAIDGAPADAEICVPAPFVFGSVIFDVDTRDQVAEASEANNSGVFSIPLPTPPPTCGITRTPTPG